MKPVVQKIRGKLWVHLNGKTHVLDEEIKAFGSVSSRKSNTGALLAPMPGKITKILKQAGDVINAGDVVLMMEAMKMEYTLKAEGPGEIEALLCQVGEQVPLGKVLVKIKPEVSNG
jgi:biotin carboxyl carrier protein